MEFILETKRLLLREWKEEDKSIFYEMNSNPIVMEFFTKKLNEEESNASVERIKQHIQDRGYGLWAVEEKETKQFIGFIGFNYTEMEIDFCPCIEIGWRLHKNIWGRGYATEGAKACLEYAYESLHFDEIYSFTSKINVKSEHIMQKIGMTKVKEFNHPKINRDNPLCEHVLYKITKEDYYKNQ